MKRGFSLKLENLKRKPQTFSLRKFMKKVFVVILNYCVAELTIKSALSVKKSTYKNTEIIVVDNNSGDEIGEKLKDFPEVEFIPSKENLGYSGGNNLGIKKALLNGADYIFILNSDATVESGAIASLVEE
ncbi:MAG: Rhamnosyl transferase, rfbQ, partial [Candidatus Daviesbacteria bacterium GW2011_GWA1_42_6]